MPKQKAQTAVQPHFDAARQPEEKLTLTKSAYKQRLIVAQKIDEFCDAYNTHFKDAGLQIWRGTIDDCYYAKVAMFVMKPGMLGGTRRRFWSAENLYYGSEDLSFKGASHPGKPATVYSDLDEAMTAVVRKLHHSLKSEDRKKIAALGPFQSNAVQGDLFPEVA